MAKEKKVTKPEGRPLGKAEVFTDKEKKDITRKFLRAFAKTGNITASCEKAQIRRKVILRWIEEDPTLQAKFEDMQEKFVDSLEMVAVERAREKSDTLLLALLKANRPQKYKEHQKVESEVKSHQTVSLVFSPDEWGDMPNYAVAQGGGPVTHVGEEETDTSE